MGRWLGRMRELLEGDVVVAGERVRTARVVASKGKKEQELCIPCREHSERRVIVRGGVRGRPAGWRL